MMQGLFVLIKSETGKLLVAGTYIEVNLGIYKQW